MGEGRDVWEHGPPPRKMRRMEWVSCMVKGCWGLLGIGDSYKDVLECV